jgi:hypothetical protein
MRRGGDWLAAALVWLSAVTPAPSQWRAPEDYVQAVEATLRQKTGETPPPHRTSLVCLIAWWSR